MKQIENYREAYIAELCLQIAPHDSAAPAVKRNLRRFYGQPGPRRRIIKENGINNYIEVVEMPDYVRTKEDAEDFFDNVIYMPFYVCGIYSNGKKYTLGHRIMKRGEYYIAYHEVWIDFE